MASRNPGRRLATETKHAFKTTEFWAYLVVAIAVLIAAASVSGGARHDVFRADKAWLFVVILTVGYLVSRGLAKAGSHEPYTEAPATDGSAGVTDRLAKAAAVLRDGDLPEADRTSSVGSSRGVPVGDRVNH